MNFRIWKYEPCLRTGENSVLVFWNYSVRHDPGIINWQPFAERMILPSYVLCHDDTNYGTIVRLILVPLYKIRLYFLPLYKIRLCFLPLYYRFYDYVFGMNVNAYAKYIRFILPLYFLVWHMLQPQYSYMYKYIQ
jgi:hypothetical protein